MTTPEELAAEAYSVCFAMALALRLGEYDATAQRLEVTATVSLHDVDGRPTVVAPALQVRAQVPVMDTAAFRATDHEPARLCPISRLFAGAAIAVGASPAPAWLR